MCIVNRYINMIKTSWSLSITKSKVLCGERQREGHHEEDRDDRWHPEGDVPPALERLQHGLDHGTCIRW